MVDAGRVSIRRESRPFDVSSMFTKIWTRSRRDLAAIRTKRNEEKRRREFVQSATFARFSRRPPLRRANRVSRANLVFCEVIFFCYEIKNGKRTRSERFPTGSGFEDGWTVESGVVVYRVNWRCRWCCCRGRGRRRWSQPPSRATEHLPDWPRPPLPPPSIPRSELARP